jgi:hypothetical protein
LPSFGGIALSAIARHSHPNGTVLAIVLSRSIRALSMGPPAFNASTKTVIADGDTLAGAEAKVRQ